MNNKHDRKDEYTPEELHQERKYGLFWYSWLWHILRPVALLLCVLVVVVGIVMAGWNWINRSFFAPVDAQDATPVAFTVSSGQSLTRVANNLESAGLIHNRTVFKYYADFLGYGQKIQAGDYQVNKAMSMHEIMDLLTTGDGNPITRNITIIPGWTVTDIAAYLKKQGAIQTEEEFLSLCRTGQDFSAYYYVNDVLKTGNVSQHVDHHGGETTVDAGLTNLKALTVIQMESNRQIGVGNGSLHQLGQIDVLCLLAGAGRHLQNDGRLLQLGSFGDTLNDLHIIDVESTDGVTAGIGFLEHFFCRDQRHG